MIDDSLSLEVKLLLAMKFVQVTSFKHPAAKQLLREMHEIGGTTFPRFTTTTLDTGAAVLVELPDYSVWTRGEPLDLFEYAHLKDCEFVDLSDPTGQMFFAARH